MPKLYIRDTWNDEVLSASATYNVSGTAVNLSGVSIDLATPISVTGTALNASRMNNIEGGIDAVDNALLSGTFAPTTAYGTYRLDGRYTASGTTIPYAGYLQEGTALLTYITGTSYRVEAGSLDVNGTLLSFSALTRAGLALASGTVHNVYIGASGTSPFLEESTTAPCVG